MSDGAITKTAIPCACVGSCGCVVLIDLEAWGDEPHQVYVEFSLGYRGRFRDRIKAAWRIVRGRNPWFHSVCLYDDGAEKVAAALRGERL